MTYGEFEEHYKKEVQKTKTIICVDSDTKVLQVMKRVLDSSGYDVYAHSSIEVAEQMISLVKVDLLFLDTRIAELNFRSLTKIAEKFPKIPTVLVFSGTYAEMNTPKERGKYCGILHKPFTTEVLSTVTDEVLKKSHSGYVGCE